MYQGVLCLSQYPNSSAGHTRLDFDVRNPDLSAAPREAAETGIHLPPATLSARCPALERSAVQASVGSYSAL